MKRRGQIEENLKRINSKKIMFNNKELNAIDMYCKKYRINNKSRFMRETIIMAILKKFNDDYPTLWTDQSMNRL
jgi:hypothetical protein